MIRAALVLLCLAVAMPAAVPAAAQEAQDLPRSDLVIVSGDKRLAFRVQWARTPDQLATGLMFRSRLPKREGMLLDYGTPQRASIWMRNTFIPLDIVFIKPDGRIESIQRGQPLDETTIPSRGPVRAVLELPAGTARRLGIKPGDRVRHTAFGNAGP